MTFWLRPILRVWRTPLRSDRRFWDHEFMELTAQMPSTLKMKGWEKKYLLKKMAQKYLPQENIQRSKKGLARLLNIGFGIN